MPPKRFAVSLLFLFCLALLFLPLPPPPATKAQVSGAYSIGHRPTVFASLGTPEAGQQWWCSDCAATSPCTGGGSGAFASGVGAQWNCSNGSAGTGDVAGPASSTDNALARFDLATGKLLQNSTVLVGDTGNVTGLGTLNTHTIPGGSASTFALISDKLSVFSATTSAELAGVLSDETGSGGGFVRATGPTLSAPNIGAALGTSIALGTNPASAGIVALPNNQSIIFRNAANSNNVQALSVDSSNNVNVGTSSFNTVFSNLWTLDIGTGALRNASTYPIHWNNQGVAISASGTSGTAEINNGTAGTQRDLKLRGLQHVTGTRPTCDSTNRGMTWYVAGGAGVADTYELCRKDAADVYAWVTLF